MHQSGVTKCCLGDVRSWGFLCFLESLILSQGIVKDKVADFSFQTFPDDYTCQWVHCKCMATWPERQFNLTSYVAVRARVFAWWCSVCAQGCALLRPCVDISPHSPRPPLSSVCLFTFRSLSVPFLYLHPFFCLICWSLSLSLSLSCISSLLLDLPLVLPSPVCRPSPTSSST